MANNSNNPEVRFAGYNEDWVVKEFHLLFNGVSNNSLSRDKLNYHYGNAKNVHYGDILVKYNEILDVKNQVIPYVNDNEIVEKLKSSKLFEGDIILSDAAEDETVGKCVEVINIEKEIVFAGLHTIALRPKQNFASKYLGYYLNSDAYHDQLLKLMQGTKVLSISKTSIKNTKVRYPENKTEQTQIGNFFLNLDRLLTQHQQKLTKFQTLKNAMLDKMFPKDGATVPEIRFKGFTSDWEKEGLSSQVHIFSGLTYSPNDVVKDKGTFVIRSSNIKDSELVDADNVYVNELVVNCDFVQENDIIVVVRNGSRNLIGKHAQVKSNISNTVIGAFMAGLRPIESNFINALLDTKKFKQEINKNLGATINQITTGNFNEMKFFFPKNDEQQKIGNYFKNLDTLIKNHKEQLTKLQNLKKACLAKMFV